MTEPSNSKPPSHQMPSCPRCRRNDKIYYYTDYDAYGPAHYYYFRLPARDAYHAAADAAARYAVDADARLDVFAAGAYRADAVRYRDDARDRAYASDGAAAGYAARYAAYDALLDFAAAPAAAGVYMGERTKFCFFRPTSWAKLHICDYKH